MRPDHPDMLRAQRETHVFQNIRPFRSVANAICGRCGLMLPHGAILSVGPNGLPPCPGPGGDRQDA